MWPHGRQPTRLPCPWDSPGKNTGVGCHFLLQRMHAKSLQSCPTVRPHRLQATRLRCPQDSLGKNTGVGYHFLLPTGLYRWPFMSYVTMTWEYPLPKNPPEGAWVEEGRIPCKIYFVAHNFQVSHFFFNRVFFSQKLFCSSFDLQAGKTADKLAVACLREV